MVDLLSNQRVYFTAAVNQRQAYGQYYQRIIKYLAGCYPEVWYDRSVTCAGQTLAPTLMSSIQDYRQVQAWIDQADIMVVEVAFPSTLQIGHEVAMALSRNKPVVALYYGGHEPSYFLGNQAERLILMSYQTDDLEETLADCLAEAQPLLQTKFTLNVSSLLLRFLNFAAKRQGVAKSVYVRRLIAQEMTEYASLKLFKP